MGLCCCTGMRVGSVGGGMKKEDLLWLSAHTNYSEKEIYQLYKGFQQDFPGGGIFRRQFERFFMGTNDLQNQRGKKMSNLVFKTLDTDNNGYLDFREFLLGVDLVGARTPEEKLIWAFKMYDIDNSGIIDRSEMENVMKSIYSMLAAVSEAPPDDPKKRANAIFSEIDINDDGGLSQEEFLKGCLKDDELMKLLEQLFNVLTTTME
ncbi:neuronal calcium sensor 2-like [Tigriopus californicus]|nr:neuronal calcium sensor 2-like [Tigriopus californicus]